MPLPDPQQMMAAAPKPPRRKSLLERLFPNPYAGQGDLTDEEMKTAQQQGLLYTGLGLLSAAGPRPVGEGPTFGGALLGGLMAGQQAANSSYETGSLAAQQRAAQQEEAARKALWQQLDITGKETPAELYGKLQRGFVLAAQSGQEKLAGYIAEMAKSLGANLQGSAAKPTLNAGYDPIRVIGPDGQLLNTIPGIAKPAEPNAGAESGAPTPVTRLDAATQQPVEVYWDKYARKWKHLDGTVADVLPMERRLTEAQLKARAFISSVDSDIGVIDELFKSHVTVTDKGLALTGQGLTGQVLRAKSPQAQMLVNTASTLAEAWLRMTTGAAYTQLEWDNARNRFLIMPTDSKATVEWKQKNMRLLQNMLRAVSSSPELAEEYIKYGNREDGRRPGKMKVPGMEELEKDPPPGVTLGGSSPSDSAFSASNVRRFLGKQ